jgi:hypothetical protein
LKGELKDNAAGLSVRDAQIITRAFKYGMMGTLLGLYAWNNSSKFGGVYVMGQQAPKDKESGLKNGEIALSDGMHLSHYLTKGPTGTYMNIVADARRYYDEQTGPKGRSPLSTLPGVALFSLGALGSSLAPLSTGARLLSPFYSAEQKMGELLRNIFEPGVMQDVAEHFDKNENGDIIRREPKTVGEELESGIPGLREQVDAKGGTKQDESPDNEALREEILGYRVY